MTDPAARHMVNLSTALQFGMPAHTVSLLYALAYLAGAGGWSQITPVTRYRFEGGSQMLAIRWADVPFTAGCESAFPPSLLTTVRAAVRESVGSIRWAATETATANPGWMDGAVEAGLRRAAEVARLIGASLTTSEAIT